MLLWTSCKNYATWNVNCSCLPDRTVVHEDTDMVTIEPQHALKMSKIVSEYLWNMKWIRQWKNDRKTLNILSFSKLRAKYIFLK